MRIKIQLQNEKEVMRALQRAPQKAEKHLQKGIDAGGAILAKNTGKNDPVPYQTGNLLHSFRASTSRLEHRWYPTAKYARIIDEGGKTRPHTIRPRAAQALYWPGAEHPVKKVDHPGSKIRGQNYMQKIVDKSRPEIEQTFNKITRRLLDEVASDAA